MRLWTLVGILVGMKKILVYAVAEYVRFNNLLLAGKSVLTDKM